MLQNGGQGFWNILFLGGRIMRELLELYCTFFRIGGLTFGGGLTMLPMFKYELSEKKGWVQEDELLDYYAIGQCTPGIIAVNVSTFVGYKRKGLAGAIAATLGMVSPSLIIVSVLAIFLDQFMSNQVMAHAIAGVKVVVCALMTNTVITLAKKSVINGLCAAAALAAFLGAALTPVPTVLFVAAAGITGIALQKTGVWRV